MTARMNVQNPNKSFHETYISATPFPYGLGVIKSDVTPEGNQKEVEGGTAYRGAGSTTDRLAHNSTNCKEKLTKIGYVAGKRDIPCFYAYIDGALRHIIHATPNFHTIHRKISDNERNPLLFRYLHRFLPAKFPP